MSASRFLAVARGGAAALLLLACSMAHAAQRPLSEFIVRVIDPSGAPVPGARVTLSSRDGRVETSRATDPGGEAAIQVPLEGSYLLEVDAEGFARAVRPIDVAAEGGLIAVSLQIAGLSEHVVVTASSRAQTAAELSRAVTVVDAAEIEARHEFSIADALRTVPGVAVQQLGGAGAFTSIKLRGLREQDTAILIDGVRIRDAASPQGDATAFAGDLAIASIDRIEVLRGSGSSLYGSHAIGGVVNLMTPVGSGPPTGRAAAEAGGLGFRRVAGDVRGSAAHDRIKYSAGAAHTSVADGLDGDDDARSVTLQGRADIDIARAGRVTLRVYGTDASAAVNDSPAAIGPLPSTGVVDAVPLSNFLPSPNDPDSRRDAWFVSALARYEQRVASGFGFTLTFHRLATTRVFHDGPLGVAPFEPAGAEASRFAGTIHTLDGRVDREWNRSHVTTLGYEFERELYASRLSPVDPSLTWQADLEQQSQSAYVQHELRFDAVDVSASARAQRFALHRVDFSPADRAPFGTSSLEAPPPAVTADVSIAYRIAPTGGKIRAHLGNAYRAPTMFERTGASFGSRGYSVFGDPRLAPERSVAVDAGVDQPLFGGRALVSATWFETRLTSAIAFGSLDAASDPFGRSAGYRTADGRSATGVELSARVQPSAGLAVNVGYTFVDAAPPAGDLDGLPRAAAVPAHQLSAVVMQRVERLQWSFELEAAGDHYVTLFDPVSFGARAYRFAGLVKADLAASYAISDARWRVYGVFENLLDRAHFVQGFRVPGRTGRAGLEVAF
jgi:iron complex outermembrane receptor protein